MTEFEAIVQTPLKPTWARYKEIFWKNRQVTIYRALEYEALSQVEFSGAVLDIGGGDKAHYRSMVEKLLRNGTYESVNISPEMQPTYLINPGDSLPVPKESYDVVMSVNTLEHVFAVTEILREMVDVTKKGGRLVLAVPFLYRVHGCPDDYLRPTASWWSETLRQLGLRRVEIRPLVWDVLTSGLSVTEGAGPFPNLRRLIVPLYGLVYAFLRARASGPRYPREIGENISAYSLGFVISATK